MFPGVEAVGREFSRPGDEGRRWQVVGVIADLRHGGPLYTATRDVPQVFFPLEPTERDLNTAMTIVVRPSGETGGVPEQLRRVAESIGSRVLVERVRMAEDWFDDRVITPKRRMVLLGLLGAFGFVLALVGVASMTAYAVTRRTAEIGLRVAFGAGPDQAVRTILSDTALPIVVGALAGIAGALVSTRVIESFLFETSPNDPVTLAAVALLLVVAACLAALVPALRAARIDPVISLRRE